jgi:hypothetical protein
LEQSTVQIHQGKYAGQLNYNFSTTGNDYVVFLWSQVLSGQPDQIIAWVYGDGSGHYLNIWINDAAGETWQFTFGKIEHVGWQQMTAKLDPKLNWPVTRIGEPANGLVDYPISFHALVLDDIPDSYTGSGTIFIDDLMSSRRRPVRCRTVQGRASWNFLVHANGRARHAAERAHPA